MPAPQSILHFWFEELTPKQHFVNDAALVHEQAVLLFTQLGIQDNLNFELRHKAIIDRFGRYPHRNAVLGRSSSVEELAFLNEPGSSF
jgi:uncharacterized protein (DUF924 family)